MKLLSILLFLCTTYVANAQNWESIKSNPAYLYGEGWGTTISDADNNALSALISKIAVNVSSVTSQTEQETIAGDKLSSQIGFNQMISTYSQATLTNTERIIISNEPDAHVGRWIKKSEIEKIFESRKFKIKDLLESAFRAENAGKADDALRCYYWALALVQSLQRPNDASYTDDNGKKHMLAVWIPELINGVFSDLKVAVTKMNESDVDLLITYKGKPVSSIDYTYFDGRDWSNIYSAKDGRGILELAAGNNADHFQLKYEYEYRGQSHIDKEIQSVLSTIKSIPMRNAYVDIKANAKPSALMESSIKKADMAVSSKVESLAKPMDGSEKYEAIMGRVTKAIRDKQFESVSSLFTTEALDIYHKLIKYGNARILGNSNYTFYQSGDEVIGRGVQMSFTFKTSLRKAFVEDVVFTFNGEGKISNISFGMGKTAETDILGKGVWSESARKSIMEFLENYKTAYALKRIDYIKNIFDDDAVIITGRVIRKMTLNRSSEAKAYVNSSDIITYNRQTKNEYISNLTRSFASNEFINIRFANNDVIKLAKGGEMYAIQIAQDYYSSNYGDKGYLFLIVDINDPKQPIIKVRTWQPEKDPNFGLYGPGDF